MLAALVGVGGCASQPVHETPVMLTDRMVAAQQRLHQDLASAKQTFVESIAEALATARAAQQQNKNIDAALASSAKTNEELRKAIGDVRQQVQPLSTQIKAMDATLQSMRAEAPAPDQITLQVRIPSGPLKREAKGAQVRRLHQALRLYGIAAPLGSVYTRDTEQAVRRFQREEGLPITGLYDSETAARLLQSFHAMASNDPEEADHEEPPKPAPAGSSEPPARKHVSTPADKAPPVPIAAPIPGRASAK